MRSILTLGDGFISVCPFPETLLAKLHYWKRQLVVNERTHRREFKATNELLYTLQTGVGPDGQLAQTCFTLQGFAKRCKDHLALCGYEVEVVDTVGAGDIFHGAFAAMVTMGKSVRDCALYSSATSAIKCTRIGGRAGIPTMDVLEKFIKTGEIDYSEIDKRVEFYRKGNENLVY